MHSHLRIKRDGASRVAKDHSLAITPLMREVALEIMNSPPEVIRKRFYFIDIKRYLDLNADMVKWCETHGRPMCAHGGEIHNFEFAGTFVTCVPEELWPE